MTPPEAGRLLGVEPPNLSGVRTREEAEERLATWKAEVVRGAWRREVRRHHPDLARDEADRAEREERTKRINRARDVLGEIRIVVQRPRPVRTRVVFVHHGGGRVGFAGSSTSSATTTGKGYPWNY